MAEGRDEGKSVWDMLFGLQLGVIGGIIMLAWFALICPLVGKPWWLIPNLFASHFYNSREVYLGPGIVTVVGVALQIVMSGVVGCFERTRLAGRASLRFGSGAGLVRLFDPVSLETNRPDDAHGRDSAHSLDRLLSVWLGVGLAQALDQGPTRKPGRLIGTETISVPYRFSSSLNLAAFPSNKNVRPAES